MGAQQGKAEVAACGKAVLAQKAKAVSAQGLAAIFTPASVAVVGASNRAGSVGRAVFKNILESDYSGIIYPVNPKAKSICGVRAYSGLSGIPDQVDLAVLIVPAAQTPAVAREAAAKGVRALIVISAGFRETGPAGAAIEQELVAVCLENDMRLVGPNCLGIINTDPQRGLNASFARQKARPGNIAFISQSGALCTAVLDFAAKKNIGFSKFISVGNKADIGELALIRYLHDDPQTRVIMLYVEELRHGAEFIETVREITGGDNPTPILAIKAGRTAEGAAAVSSHTGSLAGSEAVYNALFEQSGVFRAQSIEELFDYAVAFANQPLPRANRMAIITNAGGPGIIATDVTIHSGLRLAKLGEATTDVLRSHLPATANIHNPVDVIGDARSDRYQAALEAVLNDENVDGVIFILTPQSMTEIEETAAIIPALAHRSGKPVVASFMGLMDVSRGIEILEQHRIPHYHFPEAAARAMSALYQYSCWLHRQHLKELDLAVDRIAAAKVIRRALQAGTRYLGEVEGNEILAAYGFPMLPARLAASPDQAAAAVAELGPCAMKIVSPQIVHKSDVGGVRVGISTPDAARRAYEEIVASARQHQPDADVRGVFMQRMAARGVEVILGIKRYPAFGPLLMFGLGGIFVEIFKDVSFRLAPIRHNGARHMVRSIKAYPMLNGARGAAVADQEELERCLLRLSMLACDHPEIVELDINPLMVHEQGKGCSVADCRILLRPPESAAD
ncbi:MAG: acetate--CoA ligase alpha subunit [Thermodesulfobacteriota bacterium]